MTKIAAKSCPDCGAASEAGWPGGNCPGCLVQIAIDWPSLNSTGGPVAPPGIELLRERIPSLEIVTLIGCGGMGAVYMARQPQLDRAIALKVLPVERSRDVIAVERFRRESRVLAQLDHPNIVRVYDSGQEGDLFYLVMEFVDGVNLRDFLASGPVPAREVRRIAMQLCDAIQAAHDLGCVHRDLKPENILLDESGRVKVTDFGIALWAKDRGTHDSLTTATVRVGTPHYMAPEQRGPNRTIDHRADLFAVGIMLFELLTGEGPQLEYRPPSQLAGVDRRWNRIIAKCLKSAPGERFQSARELRDAIQRTIPADAPAGRRVWRRGALTISVIVVGAWLAVMQPWQTGAGTGLSWKGVRTSGPIGPDAAILPRVTGAGMTSPSASPKTNIKKASREVQAEGDSASTRPALPATTSSSPDDHPLVSPQWTWSPPENLAERVNSRGDESHPTISADGLTLLFLRDFSVLWQSQRMSIDEPFLTAYRLPGPINDDGPVDSPYLSRDGLTVWLASSRPGSVGDLGQNDLWEARRSRLDMPFDTPLSLGPTINSPWEESTPCVTDDGRQLYFCVRRPDRPSLVDLFVATRDKVDEPFSEPKPISGNLNGPGNDFFPRLADNGRILFFTSTNLETREQQLFTAVRSSTQEAFRAQPSVSAVINEGIVSAAALFGDDRRVIYDSNRGGGRGGFDLWMSRRIPVSNGSTDETGAGE